MKVVFMGSADFGIPSLSALVNAGHDIVGVVTTPARPKGRGLKLVESPVTAYAVEQGIGPILKPESLRDPHFVSEITKLGADMFVVVAFRILPKDVFSIPRLGTVNVHASLLPKYRGPAPIHRAIEAGETRTGVTIFVIDEGIDTGRVIARKAVDIGVEETTPELYERLSALGAEALVESVSALENGTAKPIEQDSAVSTKAPKLSREEARIDWNVSAVTLYNRVLAFKPFPGTYCFFNGKRLGIEWCRVSDEDSTGKGGVVTSAGPQGIEVQCGRGRVRIVKVKPEGRKPMDVRAFLCGTNITEGTVLE